MTKKAILITTFIILAILHQDFWNWDNSSLIFNFIPLGLFYHACYSITAAIFWAVVIKIAWPKNLETSTTEESK